MALHKHHILPRHAGGTDDASNIVMLTIEQHAEAHRVLYEQHGRWQDLCAWKVLSGQVTAGEAATEAARRTNTGRKKTASHRLKLAIAKLGKPMSKDACEAMRAGQTGRRHPEKTKKKIGESQRGKRIKPESIQKYVTSRQKTDGTSVVIEGRSFPTHSQAARAMKDVWGISLEAARGRIRVFSRTDIDRAYIALRERMKRHVKVANGV